MKFRDAVCVNAKTAARSCEGGEGILPDYLNHQAGFIIQLGLNLSGYMGCIEFSMTLLEQ